MNKSFFRMLMLGAAFAVGCLLPGLANQREFIRYLLMFMFFAVCLQLKPSLHSLHWTQGASILYCFALAFLLWFLLRKAGHPDLALAIFFTAITPTATAAPVIVNLLGGNVEYTTTAFFTSNFCIFLALPAVLPPVVGNSTPGIALEMLRRILLITLLPLVAAGVLRLFLREKAIRLGKFLSPFTFYAWILVIVLVAANASDFFRQQVDNPSLTTLTIGFIALLTLAICALNFSIGRMLGTPDFPMECSQTLGQKNTSFTIYLALTYVHPIAALGPTCYVLWHNAWNAWQIYKHKS
jgi:BASS family bile acid:Na+ symporter